MLVKIKCYTNLNEPFTFFGVIRDSEYNLAIADILFIGAGDEILLQTDVSTDF